jgi:hypothetical protein
MTRHRLGRSACPPLLVLALFAASVPVRAASVTRSLPAHYTPSTPLAVELTVHPDPGVRVQLVAEGIPAGWSVTAPSHDGAFDAGHRSIKWGPFLDALPRTLTYRVTPPATTTGTHTFDGEARFDGTAVRTDGGQTTRRFPGTLARTQPGHYLPGTPFEVSLRAVPAPDVTFWMVEERIPAGWSVDLGGSGSGGAFDALNRKVKWGPYFDADPRTLAYALTPPPNARQPAELTALARFDAAPLEDRATVPVQPNRLARTAPASYRPGVAFSVTLIATPAPYTTVATLEETLPEGWTPTELGPGATWDAANRKLKWGPYLGCPPPIPPLTYGLTPPPDADRPAVLTARGRFDEAEITDLATIPRHRNVLESAAARSLPASYDPGNPVPATISVIPADTVRVYAVEETIPPGWTVDAISHGGAFDATRRCVKWGPFLDPIATPRTLLYSVQPPEPSTDDGEFAGEVRFDRLSLPIAGPTRLPVRPSRLDRAMPARYTPAVPVTITLTVGPAPRIAAHAVEEQIPANWTVGSLTDGGEFDPVNRKIKWGPFGDHTLRTLVYTLTPPTTETEPVTLAGRAVFDHASAAVSGSHSLVFNASPTAGTDPVTRRAGEPAKVLVTDLLANDTDPEADFLEIKEIAGLSARGVKLELEWPWVLYLPGPEVADDSFAYTVGDPYGGRASGIVEIRVTDPPAGLTRNLLAIETLSDPDRIRITWVGIPGRFYRVQATDHLVPPVIWTTLGAVRAGEHGLYEFTDPAPTAGQRFYRALSP